MFSAHASRPAHRSAAHTLVREVLAPVLAAGCLAGLGCSVFIGEHAGFSAVVATVVIVTAIASLAMLQELLTVTAAQLSLGLALLVYGSHVGALALLLQARDSALFSPEVLGGTMTGLTVLWLAAHLRSVLRSRPQLMFSAAQVGRR
ncbi:MAG: hypothetical protein CSA58_03165 [Micrococcales bacterium]|nr:MAG: hypothetical protein CSB46_00805 [Micrococcales bacterium]PIE27664.1 MAG: hypothetical protein CSA58_03165 [Micrococcales bacterium]